MSSFSDTIKLSRVLCIFFVMFVHVYTGSADFPRVEHFSAIGVVYRLMFDILGRSSLPLLTIISGWLLAELDRPLRKVLRNRVRTLVVPLVLWNLLMLAAQLAWAQLSGEWQDVPATPLEAANGVIALAGPSANLPLAFLRDLLVVSALSPLVVLGVRRFGVLLVAPLLVLAIVMPYGLVILRTQILFFFALGIWLHQVRFQSLGKSLLAVFALLLAGSFGWEIMALAHGTEWSKPEGVSMANRICLSALVWHGAMAVKGSWIGRALIRLEPLTFLAFCSHFLLFAVMAVPGRALFGDVTGPLYPLYFFIQPPLGYACAYLLTFALRPLPAMLKALNAGRDPWEGSRPVAAWSSLGPKPA